MRPACRLVFTTGPERGKVFEVTDELVHIGRSTENQIVLDDPSLAEHHASIVQKSGRFAIYCQPGVEVQVDGGEIPVEKWVWLRSNVRLQFGRRSTCQFSYEEDSEPEPRPTNAPTDAAADAPADSIEFAADSSNTEPDAPVAGTSPKKKADKKPKRKKQLARFITDQGDPLVELGADGQLPELALDEGKSSRDRVSKPKAASPALLYAVLALSLAMSMALLLLDAAPNADTTVNKNQARRDIVRFYGIETDELKPYQNALRAARLAHSRGDHQTERRQYRKVLDELSAEDSNQHVGVTGHFRSDHELKQLIGLILSQDDE